MSDIDDLGFLEEYYLAEELDGEFEDELEDEVDDELDDAQLAETFRGVLREDYAGADPEEVEDALFSVLDSLTPAESFNFAKALSQIEKGASRTLQDPAVAQAVQAGAPIAGGALGTVVGGPLGAAVGSGLGRAAAGALGGGRPAAPPPAPATTAPPRVAATTGLAGGSAAATKGVILTQHPGVLQSLASLALGEHGRRSIDGVPVGAVMNLLSSVFARAAADADELARGQAGTPDYLLDGEGQLLADPAAPGERAHALYASLIDAENEHLSDPGSRP